MGEADHARSPTTHLAAPTPLSSRCPPRQSPALPGQLRTQCWRSKSGQVSHRCGPQPRSRMLEPQRHHDPDATEILITHLSRTKVLDWGVRGASHPHPIPPRPLPSITFPETAPLPPDHHLWPQFQNCQPPSWLDFFPIALISIRHGIDFMFGLFIPQISAPQGQGSYLLAPRTVLGRPTMLIKYL